MLLSSRRLISPRDVSMNDSKRLKPLFKSRSASSDSTLKRGLPLPLFFCLDCLSKASRSLASSTSSSRFFTYKLTPWNLAWFSAFRFSDSLSVTVLLSIVFFDHLDTPFCCAAASKDDRRSDSFWGCSRTAKIYVILLASRDCTLTLTFYSMIAKNVFSLYLTYLIGTILYFTFTFA